MNSIKFSGLSEAVRREIYLMVCKSHDAGAECMKAWILLRLDSFVNGALPPDGVLGRVDPARTEVIRSFCRLLHDVLSNPKAGMHGHEPFETFEAELIEMVRMQGVVH